MRENETVTVADLHYKLNLVNVAPDKYTNTK